AAFRIEGRSVPAGAAMPMGERRWVTPDYLRTLGIRLERGRFFSDSDRAGAEPVFVIDDKLARQYWPGEDPIGERIQPASGEGWRAQDRRNRKPGHAIGSGCRLRARR